MNPEFDLTYPCKPRIQSTCFPPVTNFNKAMLAVKKNLMPKDRKKKVVQVWDKNVMRKVV